MLRFALARSGRAVSTIRPIVAVLDADKALSSLRRHAPAWMRGSSASFSSRQGVPPPPPPGTTPAGGKIPQPPAPQQQAGGLPPTGTLVPPEAMIVEATEESFRDLISSSPVPVLLDCYADWCEPCRQLTPLLEAEVKNQKGRLVLAKLNVDKYEALAGSLQVRSLPTVFGVFQGKLVDMFTGIPTKEQLSAFLHKMLDLAPAAAPAQEEPTGHEAEVLQADELMKDKQVAEAGALYKKVYNELAQGSEPSPLLQARCLAGLAKCALVSGLRNEAEQLLASLKSVHQAEIKAVPDIAATVSFIELGLSAPADEEGNSAADTIKKLEAAVSADPADLEARHNLALKLFQLERFEEAINQELEIIKRDKAWNGGAANQLLLKIFETLGPGNDLAKKSRARMTNLLFL